MYKYRHCIYCKNRDQEEFTEGTCVTANSMPVLFVGKKRLGKSMKVIRCNVCGYLMPFAE